MKRHDPTPHKPKKHYDLVESAPPPASNAWIFAGFIFGPIGWLVALATDNGDGRARKAMSGCLIPVVIIVILWVVINSILFFIGPGV